MDFTWMLILALLTFVLSILYFFLFSRKQERFMQFWGFSWVAYSCSLLCLLLYFSEPLPIFLEMRKVIDMFNLLLLLFGTYSFIHIKTPTYWYRFSLYMVLLALICMLYNFQLLSFYLPISIYQIIITLFICSNIFNKWNVSQGEKVISIIVFLTWGIGKSILSIVEIFINLDYNLYITELILSNIVNFCTLTIYIVYTRSNRILIDSLYKTVVENSRDAIIYYTLTPYRSFRYVSPSIEDFTGFPAMAFYSDPKFYLNMVTGNQIDEIEEIFQPHQNDTEAFNEAHIMELSKKNGEKFWGEFKCNIIPGTNEKPKAIQITLRDVTQLKSTEMEQLNATKSRNMLLSYISHELRTPITSIAGYLAAINDGVMESPQERKEAMDIITSKTLTLKKLIDDLDQLTKLETNQFTFDFSAYTAADSVEYMLESSLNDAKSAGFSVEVSCDMNELRKHWIIIDIDRIKQVFNNLVTNSIKYSGAQKTMTFTFEIDNNNENFIVSVKDSGIGIRDEDISHIFDRFYRVSHSDTNTKNIDGRGLGLTLCKEIITAHQGNIYAESIYGFGSTFTFYIPLFKEA